MGIYGSYAHRLMEAQSINEGFFNKSKNKSKTFKNYFKTEEECTDFELELEESLVDYFKKKNIAQYANSIVKKMNLQDIAKVISNPNIEIFGYKSEINIDIIDLDIFKYANKNKLNARTTEATNYMTNISKKLASELNSNIKDFDFKFVADFGDWDDYSIYINISVEQGYNFWKENK